MKQDNAALLDIFHAAQRILAFSAGLEPLALATNLEKQSAILYQIIVIGEAVKRLSPKFRNQHPEIPWKDIAGMRDIVAHQYDRVDLNDLWSVLKSDIPELLAMIRPLLTSM
ncbi:DUF86 domain-containing protein [Leptolyngbya sp. PCC 6406]|uniref:HepT-like ribonuclease domain-containing protein n=1 Tax=Leptolyngbya sp. PCC 6406 TaxID=1173264 RepID=UPI0002ABB78D|nr:DUF86 domain-containing protein [Leptolyngbya sp. PCC 6406]